MKYARYVSNRQKSCDQCYSSKVKCHRGNGACKRCAQRGVRCSYQDAPPDSSENPDDAAEVHSERAAAPPTGNHNETPEDATNLVTLLESLEGTDTRVQILTTDGWSLPVMGAEATRSCLMLIPDEPDKERIMDFGTTRLFCPIDATAIQNRWLSEFVPIPGQVMINYPPNITALIHQILKSYTGAAIRGRGGPPFVHTSQKTDPDSSRPLTLCLNLVRVFDNPILGPEPSTVDLIHREMANIQARYRTFNEMGILAAFQAYLIYTMTLFFYVSHGPKDFLAETMSMLQDIACYSSIQGLVPLHQGKGTRPRWEEWIVTEVKRRTLFTMYLFDCLLAAKDNLPYYLPLEMQGLPAPGPRSLWQAQARHDWTAAYNAYSAHWDSNAFLRIDELWPVTLHEVDLRDRSNRVDLWLEDLDEFGTMVYAVTSGTHTHAD